jgi:transcriptional repressor NrdR
MNCPKCNSTNLKVLEKRDVEGEPAIRRRRECNTCNYRFTTFERPETPSLTVIKKDGAKQPYSREKISAGVLRALEKRPVDQAKIEELILNIEKNIYNLGSSEIKSSQIGDMVLNALKDTDEVAYMRFVSVYRSFDDIDHFKEEADNLHQIK